MDYAGGKGVGQFGGRSQTRRDLRLTWHDKPLTALLQGDTSQKRETPTMFRQGGREGGLGSGSNPAVDHIPYSKPH